MLQKFEHLSKIIIKLEMLNQRHTPKKWAPLVVEIFIVGLRIIWFLIDIVTFRELVRCAKKSFPVCKMQSAAPMHKYFCL